ncbi:uncharacterized protein UTRI_00066 [Ustilago trichophora]|uniref:Uncharacterized protein n=1 Tax=Ustilago trichophora TaxID=86804 RepID=A0A5C3DSL1_9BASI|nr:uncharacterized protein UTRI_00066 [Ustilago trichophora]
MLIKTTSALVVAAALLPSAHAALTCRLASMDSQIISVEAFSAADVASKSPSQDLKNADWADIALSEHYHPSAHFDSQHRIVLRHDGQDCREIDVAKDNICNRGIFDEMPGNSCAQVTHKSHWFGSGSGRAFGIPRNAPNPSVHFSARLLPSLHSWKAGLPNTCANEIINAPKHGMKVLTFSSTSRHEWTNVKVTLDQPDTNFPLTWQCDPNDHLSAPQQLEFVTADEKTYVFTNINFDYLLYASNPSS